VNDSTSEQTLNVVGGFYDAAAGIQSWSNALEGLQSIFQMSGVIFEQHAQESTQLIEFESFGLPQQGLDQWQEHFHGLCPRIEFVKSNPAGTISYEDRILSRAEMARDPVYQDFYTPFDVPFFLCTTLEHNRDFYTTLSLQRNAEQGHASERDIHLLQHLTPHLQQALFLRRRLASADREIQVQRQAFDSLSTGMVFLGCKAQVLYLNTSAERSMRLADGIKIRSNRFLFTNPQFQNRLAGVLANGQNTQHKGVVPAPFFLPIEGSPIPLRMDLVSIARGELRQMAYGGSVSDAHWLMLITDPRQGHARVDRVLRSVFGLTNMEARLAIAIADGTTLADYAAHHEVALTTVRSHLANLRGKMDARSQADVVRLVMALRGNIADGSRS